MLTIVLLWGTIASVAHARNDEESPFARIWHWKTIESKHFLMHYPQGHKDLAIRALTIAEEVHENLEPILDWKPEDKVDLVLTDPGDSANGFAQIYPYNRILMYSSPPSGRSQLNDYNDWLRILIAHEYTHILHLDNKSGLPAIINLIFGKLLNPNMANPHWLIEGYAVYFESQESAGGRLRSAIFDMYMRADVLAGKMQSLDEMTNTTSHWPYATSWYLYGAHFMQYLADRFGNRIFGAIAYLYGRRLIPFGLNTVMKQVSGYDYPALYEDWKKFLQKRYQLQKEAVTKQPLTEGKRLTHAGGSHDFLRVSPNGNYAYFVRTNSTTTPGIYRIDTTTAKEELLVRGDSCGGIDLSLDGTELIISLPTIQKSHFLWHDLFIYRIGSNKPMERITQSERAVMPAFGPNKRFVAYVQYQFGKTRLVLLDRRLNKVSYPTEKEHFDEIFDPTFSPDGRFIVFVGHRLNHPKDLFMFDRISGKTIQLTNSPDIEMNPRFSSNDWLYFSSDKSGIYNVYRMNIHTKTVQRVSNVINGAFSPAPTNGSLMYIGYTTDGYDVYKYDYPPHFEPIPAPSPSFRTAINLNSKPNATIEISKPRNYSPFPSVYPHVWIPTAGADHAGATIGINIKGADATMEHLWSFEADYGIESRMVSFAGGYSNFSTPFNLSLSMSHSSQRLKDAAVLDGKKIDFSETFYNLSAGASYSFGSKSRFVYSPDYSYRIGLSYSISHTKGINSFQFEPDSGELRLPETGLNSGISLYLSYGDNDYQPQAIGTATGKGISAGVSLRHKVLGSQYNSVILNFGASYYFRIPHTKTHSIAFRLLGGMASGDYTYRRFFYIGGPPKINLVSDLLYNKRELGIFLRGYPPYAIGGDRYVLLKSEYRFEIWPINRGIATYPVFLQRIHGAVFFDAANAWGDAFDIENTVKSVGAELRLDIIIGYFAYTTLRIGYASGLDAKGEDTLFILLDNIF